MDSNTGLDSVVAANPSTLRAGFAWMRSSLRTTLARCSSAVRTTSSRRWRSSSSSVTGASQRFLQAGLVALEDADRVLEDRVALLRLRPDVDGTRGARQQEDRGRASEDGGAVRLAGEQRQREDGEKQPEGEEVEGGDRNHDQPHHPRLL